MAPAALAVGCVALASAVGLGLAAPQGAAQASAAQGQANPRADGQAQPPAPAGAVRYGRDIRPILSDRCFLCHGPDPSHRKADLRLDLAESATAPRKHGAAIVPGNPDASQVLLRVCSTSPDDIMPPPQSGKPALTAHEQALLRAWITQGAPYEPHWAFQPLQQPAVPQPADPQQWCRTPVDRFVLEGLQHAGLQPSPEASPATLARRAYLDITGLPPTPEELQAFLKDTRPDAYERLVDMLLTQEPYRTRYAERMAVPWLDLARYADTAGIHMDAGRQIWPYRDWVLEAFRSNKPFDQFVVEQIAGDLLPNATTQQRVATGFHRNHVTSDEGGAIDAEYLLEYAVDRTNTTGAVFLGLTVGCARCHDHKFDPVTMQDYYGLLAFFNSNEEPGIYSQTQDPNRAHEPFMEIPSPTQAATLQRADAALATLKEQRAAPMPEEAAAQAAFVQQLQAEGAGAWQIAQPVAAASANGATLVPQPDGSVLATGANPDKDTHLLTLRVQGQQQRLILLEMLEDPSLPGGRVGRAPNGNAALTGVQVEAISVRDPRQRMPVELTWAWADREQPDGDHAAANVLGSDPARTWAPDAHRTPGPRALLLCAKEPFGFEGGTDLSVRLRYDSIYAQHAYGRVRARTAPASAALLAQLPEATGNWQITGPFAAASGQEAYDATYGPEQAVALASSARFANQAWRHAPGVLEDKPVNLAEGVGAEFVAREIWSPDARTLDLSLGSDDGLQVFVNGTRVFEHRIDRGVQPNQDRVQVPLQPGRNTLVCKVVNTGGPGGFFHRADRAATCMARPAVALVLPAEAVSPASATAATEAWRASHSPQFAELTRKMAALQKERDQAVANVPRTMVMHDRVMPTETFVMTRGQYDKPDKSRPVQRSVPAALGTLPADAPRNRLGLAQWLVSAQNPLTARVTVNRWWEQLFGKGIVKTSEDFGLQGEWPSHPELLDWLATDLRDHQWDVQRTMRMLLTSATYRQASRVRADALAVDPDNRLLAFYPRQRLTAEQIRDQALYVSGLLVEQLGGPSVKPYQPDGLWQEVAMPQSNTRAYTQGKGQELWRRSLYTYWKRAAPPPSMLALDAPTREFCTTRRLTTNTPLQALVLWNDPQFVEAARQAAARTLHAPGQDADRLAALYERCTGAPVPPAVQTAMLTALTESRRRYQAAPDDAAKLVAVGESAVPTDIPAPELAAWTLVANAVLASDATIVKD